ncbi:(5-formylfuran-3-yl)methyl phosphate synthase [Roseiconus lacunae]|uniref:(5-formylfuran-3-yl)methyl phosphate synthase n=1 Tax=Roseiconus lacunae TaxID=2605694 RepID=UPI00308C9351|nr:(5-formylfuran-3-yl)methyl phosphate synthase [Stieleria sp. HD01]
MFSPNDDPGGRETESAEAKHLHSNSPDVARPSDLERASVSLCKLNRSPSTSAVAENATSPQTPRLGPPPSPPKIRLLVSVRNLEEAKVAIAGGVRLVDLKEPSKGSLAPTSPDIWRSVSEFLTQDAGDHNCAGIDLSIALGEPDTAVKFADQVPRTVRFAKAGLSGLDSAEAVLKFWRLLRAQLPAPVTLVAVAYADYQVAGTLSPEEVAQLALQFGLRHVLIDTFEKSGGSSLKQLGRQRLGEFAVAAQTLGIWWALAGSIDRQETQSLLKDQVWPDCIAVRGAVCEGDRAGTISPGRLVGWTSMLNNS